MSRLKGLSLAAFFAALFAASAGASVANAESYIFDVLGRLTCVTADNGQGTSYTYDLAGDRTAVSTATCTSQMQSQAQVGRGSVSTIGASQGATQGQGSGGVAANQSPAVGRPTPTVFLPPGISLEQSGPPTNSQQ